MKWAAVAIALVVAPQAAAQSAARMPPADPFGPEVPRAQPPADDRVEIAAAHCARGIRQVDLAAARASLEQVRRFGGTCPALRLRLAREAARAGDARGALDLLRPYFALPDAPECEAAEALSQQLLGMVGQVRARCSIPGASLWVDGRSEELGAAVRVLAGEHEVSVRAPGHSRDERSMQVRAGAVVSFDCHLDPVSRVGGRVQIVTATPGVEVRVDGVPQGETPLGAIDVPAGEHDLVLRRRGYVDAHRRVRVVRGEQRLVAVPMRLDPNARRDDVGMLHLEVPEGAAFALRLDGSSIPSVVRQAVPVGEHQLEVTVNGGPPIRRVIHVETTGVVVDLTSP